jgi:stage III sporulation protein AG
MKENQNQKGIFDLRTLMKNEKAVKALIFGAVALIMLFFLSDLFSPDSTGRHESVKSNDFVAYEYEKQLEQKLERAITAIDGVGEVTIVVTLDSLSETVYSERGSGVKTVITPKVRGVAIICDGADDVVVKQKVVETTARLLGVNTTRISVTR